MATVESTIMLDSEDLREVDRLLLAYLREGRVTPAYARDRIVQDGHRDSITSQYVGQRLKRLEEHGHVANLLNSGLYELVDDPEEVTRHD